MSADFRWYCLSAVIGGHISSHVAAARRRANFWALVFSDDFCLAPSSDRIRTYNPSVNSRTGCGCLALHTRLLTRTRMRFTGKLGGLWGDLLFSSLLSADGATNRLICQ